MAMAEASAAGAAGATAVVAAGAAAVMAAVAAAATRLRLLLQRPARRAPPTPLDLCACTFENDMKWHFVTSLLFPCMT